jgi:hypothetical protein
VTGEARGQGAGLQATGASGAEGAKGEVAGRTPPPPAPVVAWVERFGGAVPGASTLCDRGARALAAALDTPSGRREAAWALLAADALLTWAVEDAAEAPDPAAALDEVFRWAQAPRGELGR